MITINEARQAIKDEILGRLADGESLEFIRDNYCELVDGFMPVYSPDIIKAWLDMPSDYVNRGSIELGFDPVKIDIIDLMHSDLYVYYSDLILEIIDSIDEEISA